MKQKSRNITGFAVMRMGFFPAQLAWTIGKRCDQTGKSDTRPEQEAEALPRPRKQHGHKGHSFARRVDAKEGKKIEDL